MLLISNGVKPRVHSTAVVSKTAVIAGDVTIDANCWIGHGTIVTSDGGPVRIGREWVIMETATIRGVPAQAMSLGNNVLVGPRSYLSGCCIGGTVSLATGATIFNGAIVGRDSQVKIDVSSISGRCCRRGAWCRWDGWQWETRPSFDRRALMMKYGLCSRLWNSRTYVFGAKRTVTDGSPMTEMMAKYANALRKYHADDQPVQ